jgi:hypothetical protein
LGPLVEQRLEHLVAGGLQRRIGGVGEGAAQGMQTGVGIAMACLDQAVGVQRKETAFGNFVVDALERHPAHAEWRAGGQFEEIHSAVRAHQCGPEVTRTGERAHAGNGVVDRVQASGSEFSRRRHHTGVGPGT